MIWPLLAFLGALLCCAPGPWLAIARLRLQLEDALIDYAQTRPKVEIHEKGELYLERYYLLGRKANSQIPDEAVRLRWLPTVWVHHFVRPDSGDALHNHPWWWAVSRVLRGAYYEERDGQPAEKPVRRVAWWNFITRWTYHSVVKLEGDVWTLFVTGRYAGTWTFKTADGTVVPWREYVQARDEQSPEPGQS